MATVANPNFCFVAKFWDANFIGGTVSTKDLHGQLVKMAPVCKLEENHTLPQFLQWCYGASVIFKGKTNLSHKQRKFFVALSAVVYLLIWFPYRSRT